MGCIYADLLPTDAQQCQLDSCHNPPINIYLSGTWNQRSERKSLSMSSYLRPHGLYSPWNAPGQYTGVGNLFLLQGIFPIQGSNPGLPHCRRILYQLSHKGSPPKEKPTKKKQLREKLHDFSTLLSLSSISQWERLYGHRIQKSFLLAFI